MEKYNPLIESELDKIQKQSGKGRAEKIGKKGPGSELDLRTTEELADAEARILREYQGPGTMDKKGGQKTEWKTGEAIEDPDSIWESFGENDTEIEAPESIRKEFEKMKEMAESTSLPEIGVDELPPYNGGGVYSTDHEYEQPTQEEIAEGTKAKFTEPKENWEESRSRFYKKANSKYKNKYWQKQRGTAISGMVQKIQSFFGQKDRDEERMDFEHQQQERMEKENAITNKRHQAMENDVANYENSQNKKKESEALEVLKERQDTKDWIEDNKYLEADEKDIAA